jgi:uncharacterized protein
MMRIIDVRVTPPIPQTRVEHNPAHMKGYDKIFDFRSLKPQYLEYLARVWDSGMDAYLDEIGQLGIEKIVCCAKDCETTVPVKLPNEVIADLMHKYPDRIIGFAGVDPRKGRLAVQELERAVKELGLRGVEIEPYLTGAYVNDPLYTPVFEKCVELKIPAWVHTSMNWTYHARIDHGRPLFLEDVLMRFPDLVVIAGHTGWPWVNEMCALAWKWPNLYVDFSSIRPKYLGVAGAGYETLLELGRTVLQDKILFGSGFPLTWQKQSVDDVMALPLPEAVREKWFYHNAARVLGIEQRSAAAA